MKRFRLKHVYMTILAVVMALIVVHAPLQVFWGSQFPEVVLYIKAWKEILMILALPLAVILITRAGRWGELARDKLFWLIGAYGFLHILALLQWQGLEASLAGLLIDLRYVLYFALVYVLIWLYPEYKKLMLKLAIVGAAAVISFGLIQLLLPYDALKYIGYGDNTIRPYTTVDRNYDFIRYQSTLRGPNPYGAYAASVVVIALAWLAARKFDWRIALLAAGGTVATYLSHSRSAFIALALGIAIVLGSRYLAKLKRWHVASMAGVVLIAGLGVYMLRDSYFISNVILHEDPVGGSSVSSNDEHLRSLINGTERALGDPLGDGVGSSGSASLLSGRGGNIIENQYLMVAHEVGWLGLALFLAIFGLIMYRLWQKRRDPWTLGVFASGVGLAVIGILLPVWADDTVSIVWWGLAGILLVGEKNGKRPTKQKTTRTA